MPSSRASRIVTRTTLDLDASVLKQLKRRGRREQKSLGRVASELLARCFELNDADQPAATFQWTSWHLGAPRVDLEDKEALRAALEELG